MEKLFSPKSVAVIGASRHEAKLGYQILKQIIDGGFKGKIYPINPETDNILGLKVYAKVSEIEDAVDLAIVIVPAAIVPKVLHDCVLKKVAYAIVISSGFAEIGAKGKVLQDEIKEEILGTSPLRILGPNCLGMINANINLNATFAAPKLVKGNVAAVFQSGALGVALLDWAKTYEFGFSKFVSLGNKVDIDESEVLQFLKDDDDTKVIALYLEEISNPKKFLSVARKVSASKPIIILKGGMTKMGATAAFSHTAAMVTSAHLNRAIFAQANLIVASTIEEMLNLIQLLSCEPPATKETLGIITNAGGPAILTTDAASRMGMQMPTLKDEVISELKKTLPSVSSLANPLDLTGEALAKEYETALKAFISDPAIASILILLTPQTMTQVDLTAQVIGKYANSKKPIIASFLGDKMVASGIEILRSYNVPHFEDPTAAVKAVYSVTRYWQRFDACQDFIELTPGNPDQSPAVDALELIKQYNIPTPDSGMATNIDIANKITDRIGYPVVVKNISKNVVHKFKAGKVILNVQNREQLKQAMTKVGLPVLVQQMVESPFEVIVGAKRDDNLGVVVTIGWGGIFTEDLADISTRILPLTELDLDEMIKETKIGKILIREKVDLSGVKNILLEVGQIMVDFPGITEVDLNPIKLTANKAICVDARYK